MKTDWRGNKWTSANWRALTFWEKVFVPMGKTRIRVFKVDYDEFVTIRAKQLGHRVYEISRNRWAAPPHHVNCRCTVGIIRLAGLSEREWRRLYEGRWEG